jgi:hypothetical protein
VIEDGTVEFSDFRINSAFDFDCGERSKLLQVKIVLNAHNQPRQPNDLPHLQQKLILGHTFVGELHTVPGTYLQPATHRMQAVHYVLETNERGRDHQLVRLELVGTDLHATGNISADGMIFETSDSRRKTNVQPLVDALPKVLALRGVTYHGQMQEPGIVSTPAVGFIAQEAERVFPEVVSMDGKGQRAIAYSRLVPVLVEAFKELYAQVAELTTRLEHAGGDACVVNPAWRGEP